MSRTSSASSTLALRPHLATPPHYRVAIEAGLYGDRIARQQWQHEARVASAVPDPPRGDRPRRSSQLVQPPNDSLRLPRPLPTDHAADIYFNFNLPAEVVPLRHGLVPLSYLGPGGTSIPALSNRQHQISWPASIQETSPFGGIRGASVIRPALLFGPALAT